MTAVLDKKALMRDKRAQGIAAMGLVTREGDLEAATRVLEDGARKAGLPNLAAWTAQYDHRSEGLVAEDQRDPDADDHRDRRQPDRPGLSSRA